jgi:hypothetical protein
MYEIEQFNLLLTIVMFMGEKIGKQKKTRKFWELSGVDKK